MKVSRFGYFWLDTWVTLQCPVCGKPMIRRVAKKGINSGNEFWSCSGYPECRGTRSIKKDY